MKKILSFFIMSLLMLATCSAYAAIDPQLELNKKNVTAFYDELINQKNFDAALKYMGTHYTQHNPMIADGVEGLKNYTKILYDRYPSARAEIKHIFAEGDVVILHVHFTLEPGTRGYAVADIFKLENNKIVEHWDVIQEIPQKSANNNGMF